MDNEKKQEFTKRIAQANSTDLVVIYYDIALEYISEAKAGIENEDYDCFNHAIARIQGCISELCNSLNYDYEPAKQLRMLYDFCVRRVGISAAKRDADILDDVKKVFIPLRDAYAKIASTNTSGPVMGNTEQVYAGLTYGKGDINESYVSQSNRGYFV